MNILGLVFSLLLILSYGFYACWEKQSGSARLRQTYLGHQKVNRKILNSYESEIYERLRHKKPESEPKIAAENEPQSKSAPKIIPLNSDCAKINLWPLIYKGREENPILYEMAAKLLRTFYGSPLYDNQPRIEYKLLDAILASAKSALQKKAPFALEKLAFEEKSMRMLYYKMLKGTKKWDLTAGSGYPSLLDYVKVESGEEKICLFHAHPDILAVLFGPKAAPKLFEEMHREKAPAFTRETIEKVCSESHLVALDPDLFNLLEIGRTNHRLDSKKTLVENDPDTQISLRKNVYLHENS